MLSWLGGGEAEVGMSDVFILAFIYISFMLYKPPVPLHVSPTLLMSLVWLLRG